MCVCGGGGGGGGGESMYVKVNKRHIMFTYCTIIGPTPSPHYTTQISLVPRPSEGGGGRKAWYPLHAHALHFPYNLP